MTEIQFTPARPIQAEGRQTTVRARVEFVTCLTCGAAILLDPDDEKDALALHRRWHDDTEKYDG